MEPNIGTVLLCIALVAAGLISHFVWRMSQLEESGQKIKAIDYLREHKWATLNMILAAYGLLILAYYTGEMGPVGSFTFGIAADAAAEKMRTRARAKLEQP